MTTGTKTIKQKLFFSAMVLAFMWVIIGDLVTIHLEVYFGKKVKGDWHQPYSKTHKDDTATYKVKTHKTDGSNKHLDFDDETWALSIFHTSNKSSNFIIYHFTAHQQQKSLFLRGPPSLV